MENVHQANHLKQFQENKLLNNSKDSYKDTSFRVDEMLIQGANWNVIVSLYQSESPRSSAY